MYNFWNNKFDLTTDNWAIWKNTILKKNMQQERVL